MKTCIVCDNDAPIEMRKKSIVVSMCCEHAVRSIENELKERGDEDVLRCMW